MNKSDLIVQKEGKAKIPAEWPSNGIVRITHLSGSQECLAKSVQSVSAGLLSVHLNKDFDADGNKVYTIIPLSASPLASGQVDLMSANEVPCVFDEFRQTDTTVSLAELTVWI